MRRKLIFDFFTENLQEYEITENITWSPAMIGTFLGIPTEVEEDEDEFLDDDEFDVIDESADDTVDVPADDNADEPADDLDIHLVIVF